MRVGPESIHTPIGAFSIPYAVCDGPAARTSRCGAGATLSSPTLLQQRERCRPSRELLGERYERVAQPGPFLGPLEIARRDHPAQRPVDPLRTDDAEKPTLPAPHDAGRIEGTSARTPHPPQLQAIQIEPYLRLHVRNSRE